MSVIPYYDPEKGSACHQREDNGIPICVVTGLNHKDILLANTPVKSNWVISGATVYLQRFWSTSTAMLTLTADLANLDDLPPYLPVYGEGNAQHRLQPEDSICIYFGYIEDLRTPVTPELMEGDSPKLLRVYTGVIDTIGTTCTPQGAMISIQCRDRMRYLMDTTVCLSPFDVRRDDPNDSQLLKRKDEINKALSKSGTIPKDQNDKSTGAVFRSDVIVRVAQMGVGYIDFGKPGLDPESDVNINGLKIDFGEIQDLGELRAGNVDKSQFKSPDYFYNGTGNKLRSRTYNKVLDLNLDIKFNAIVGRLPFTTETVTKEFTIENQIPIEFIKFLGNQEPYPVEVFSNHQDGDYYYTPRKNDASGLTDPKRFFRTYYHRVIPKGVGDKFVLNTLQQKYPPQNILSGEGADPFNFAEPFTSVDRNQMTINFKEEFSSLTVKTNYIVANTSPTQPVQASIIMHMAARPAFLRGVPMGGKNMYVIDETIGNSIEAGAVALAMAKINSKELKAASITVLGDPSLVPGEVLQVIGSPLHPETINLDTLLQERKVYLDFEEKDNRYYIETLDKIRSATQEDSARSFPVLGTDIAAPKETDVEANTTEYGIRPKLIQGKDLSSSLGVFAAITKPEFATVIAPYDPTKDVIVANPASIDSNAPLSAATPTADSTLNNGIESSTATVNPNGFKSVIQGHTASYPPFTVHGNDWGANKEINVTKVEDMPLHHRRTSAYILTDNSEIGKVIYRGGLITQDILLIRNGSRDVFVPSPVAGKVQLFQEFPSGAGNAMQILDAKGKISARIMHFASYSVKDGDFVQYGQKLGIQGITGGPTTTLGATKHAHTELPPQLWKKYFNDLISGNFYTDPSIATAYGAPAIKTFNSDVVAQAGIGDVFTQAADKLEKNLISSTNPSTVKTIKSTGQFVTVKLLQIIEGDYEKVKLEIDNKVQLLGDFTTIPNTKTYLQIFAGTKTIKLEGEINKTVVINEIVKIPKVNKVASSLGDFPLVASLDLSGLGLTFPSNNLIANTSLSTREGPQTTQELRGKEPPKGNILLDAVTAIVGDKRDPNAAAQGGKYLPSFKQLEADRLNVKTTREITKIEESIKSLQARSDLLKKELTKTNLTVQDRKDLESDLKVNERAIATERERIKKLMPVVLVQPPVPVPAPTLEPEPQSVNGSETRIKLIEATKKVNASQVSFDKTVNENRSKESIDKAKAELIEAQTKLKSAQEKDPGYTPTQKEVDDVVPNSSSTATPVVAPTPKNEDSKWRYSGFLQEPKTLWRVEGIKHQFNTGGQKGFLTELALLSVFS